MASLHSAAEILRKAEEGLRELMQRTLASSDYRDLPALARIAEQVNGLVQRLEAPEASSPVSDGPATPLVPKRTKGAMATRGTGKRGKSLVKREYPKFLRDGERLVKIGWSKSERSEYRHRAPRAVANILLKAVIQSTAKKPVFAVDDLLPLKDPSDRSEHPLHQVYLALAWLKAEGIVMPEGRQGYRLLVKSDPDKLLNDRWQSLSAV